jgi:Fe2+ or Zn2+ uptake regulation protein
MVHVYPTGGQLSTGIDRLEARLDNVLLSSRWWRKSRPDRRGVGSAQVAFFSGHPLARSEGATANMLLIVNECQDQVERVVERRFTPMRASSNATALYVGTVRTTSDYLWKMKQRLEKLETQDGQQRVFVVSPYDVGAENAHYLEFVENQVAMKGRQHPTVRTEFFNEPVDVAAGLFPPRRRMLMLGHHKRESRPKEGAVYVALIDVGGQDEATTEILDNPGRDYTVCTIVKVVRDPVVKIGPVYQVVDVFTDQGSRHFQASAAGASLFDRLLAHLRHWNAATVICDMTGVGQGLTDALQEAYKRQVFGFDFAKSYGKARLGSDFLAVVETGRFQYFCDDYEEEGSDAWYFLIQAEHCGYELAEGLPIERGLRWGVAPSATVVMSDGSTELVHDDRLLSAALVAELDRLVREGLVFVATGESAVIPRTSEEAEAWS